MADGLAGELLDAGCRVVMPRDPRAGPVPVGAHEVAVRGRRPPWRAWRQLLATCDLLWPVAPETGGAMEALAGLGRRCGVRVMASDASSLRIAASKRRTAALLARAGVPVVPTVPMGLPWPPGGYGWVIKPDDGAGALGARRVKAWADARDADAAGLVVQPFLPGASLSMSLLCERGRARLLACNRQLVHTRPDGTFAFEGVEVGGAEHRRAALEPLAQAIAAALPGLLGPAGVDLVDGPGGPVVLEINPRLTTAWPGLSSVLDQPAALLPLRLLESGLEALPQLCARRVATILPGGPHA